MLALVTSTYYYLFVRVLWRLGDEGTLVYGAQRVVEGDLPYRDFFEVMGPASFYWLGLFFKLFGVHVAVARGLVLLTGVATILIIYWMTCRVYRGPFEMLPALMYMVLSIPIWPATNHHWDSNLFALLALGAFFFWQDRGTRYYLVVAGALAGVTSCFIQHKGLVVFLGLLLALLVTDLQARIPKRRLAFHLSLAVGGYVAVGGLVILLFFLAGGLPDLIYANLLWPLSNYHNVNVVPYGYGLMKFWLGWKSLLQVLVAPWAVPFLGALLLGPVLIILVLPVVLLILAAASYLKTSYRPQLFNAHLWPYWIVGLALWVSELHRKDVMHLIYGSPVLLILLLVGWSTCWRHREIVLKLGLGLVALTLLMFGTAQSFGILAAQHKLVTRRGTLYAFQPDDALNFLQEQVKPKEEVFIYPYYPMYYFLADIKNPTRHSILMYYINTKKQFEEIISNLEEKKVKYILWDTVIEGDNLQSYFPNYKHLSDKELILEQYLKKNYRTIGIKNGFRVMVRLDLESNPPK